MERETALEEALLTEENGKVSISDARGDDKENSGESSAQSPARPSVQECLAVPPKEMANVELDVYNMFYISDLWSQSFFYSIATLVTKMSLYIILIIDLMVDPDSYPFDRKNEGEEVKLIVMLAQLFLIPVAILIQEELR